MELSEKSIFRLTIFIPLVSILILAGILTYAIIDYQQDFLEKQFNKEKTQYIESNKALIKDEVNRVFDLIKFKKDSIYIRLKDRIENEMKLFYSIVNTLYEQHHKTKTKEEIVNIIKSTLREIRLNNNETYLNIFDTKGTAIMLPIQDHYEDMSIINFRDIKNKLYIKEAIEISKTTKDGYYSYYDVRPNIDQNKEFYKLNYVKTFEPLGLILSVGDYLDTIDKIIQREVAKRASEIRFGEDGYVYIVSNDGTLLSHRDKSLIGSNAFKIKDLNGKYYFKDGYIKAKENKSVFMEYVSATNKNYDSIYNAKKLSFAKYAKNYDWVISAGVYIDKIDAQIAKKKTESIQELQKFTAYIILLSIVLSVIVIVISSLLASNIKKSFILYKKLVNRKEKQLEDINNNLENRIVDEIEKSRKKDTQLLQQARFASLGEMIGNIAHQWRQPLSAISTISSANIVNLELGLLSKEDNIENNEKILTHVEFLSQTIDDFRNYLTASKDEKKVVFDIKDTIINIKKIIEVVYKDNNIDLKINFVKVNMNCYGISSQLSQVILNILNNAKDVLIQNNIQTKVVFIDTKIIDNKNVITIYDNGGGVPDEILEKIFDPYFTTKHQSQGTGIGLYMSKDIIQTKYNGILEVKNLKWNDSINSYYGACFILEIPIYN